MTEENFGLLQNSRHKPPRCDIMSAYMISAGGGSAYGGKWRPAKPADERFMGKPGEIKVK